MAEITQKQLAQILGVSHMTVNRALRDEGSIDPKTKKRILEACEKYHYRKSHAGYSLRKGNSLLIGVLAATNYSSLVTPILERIQFKMSSQGYNITIVQAKGAVKIADLEGLFAKRVDGMIITCRCAAEVDHYFKERGIPVVYNVERPLDTAELCFVGSDDDFGTRLAMDHLFSLAHEAIVHLAPATPTIGGNSRKETYRMEMESRGLPSSICQADGWDAKDGYEAMLAFLDGDRRPSAMFAAGDSLAIGAIKAIRQKGMLVPEDISVVGYGDSYSGIIDYFSPSLTTVAQPFTAIAESAVDRLMEMIQCQQRIEGSLLIEPALVIRESSIPAVR